jgi:AcrR family transcriptional regulator
MTRTDKKERIILTAIKIWQQAHNVNKVSLSDISREAGVSPTTIYNNFGTREGLIQEVIKHIFEDILNRQKAVLQSDLPFPRKMQQLLSAKTQPVRGMGMGLIDKICVDPFTKQYVAEMTEAEFVPVMKAIISEGKREGYIRSDIPDEVIMLYFDILRAGGVACADEMKRIITDKSYMSAFAQLMYFGLFQKEFDMSFNNMDKEK